MSRRIVINAGDGTEFRMCMIALNAYAEEHTAGKILDSEQEIKPEQYDFNTMEVRIKPTKDAIKVGVVHGG